MEKGEWWMSELIPPKIENNVSEIRRAVAYLLLILGISFCGAGLFAPDIAAPIISMDQSTFVWMSYLIGALLVSSDAVIGKFGKGVQRDRTIIH